ncbi:MAG: 4-hydroxy-tetrahydrodipicolinate reductase [Flavobacteriales bacterium]|nr:4-hydroxy-tetrahydrodipicolinate reductase [Flavobacteriales bacterium]MBP9080615.1 4-hydroxy-tetrahydrodipicolinate reductase [Flavobacteriales bacterium]
MKIALYGYGKMGKAVEQAALARDHQVVLRVDQHNAGTPPSGADVAIEFSRPEQALANMRLCMDHQVPVVVGTTGWYDRLEEVKGMVKDRQGSLLWASNFSIGVNLFFKLNRQLAELMRGQLGYTGQVEEIHHVHKLDAPSGTAISLAKDLIAANNRYTGWTLQQPNGPAAAPDQLPIISQRSGEVPGTHVVQWMSDEDRVTITHEAFGRQGFATGAVVAAEWLRGRTGFFTMDDVLH